MRISVVIRRYIKVLAKDAQPPSLHYLQRAVGTVSLSVAACKIRGSRLVDLREQGSLRTVFPRPSQHEVTAVILNTAGGVAAGDRFTIDASVAENAQLSITTQAAERIYGAPDQTIGRIQTTLTVQSGARINWLPQETILFDGCRLNRALNVEVAADATFLMVEPIVFGRTASGEVIHSGYFNDRVRISSEGRPVYFDSIQMSGDMTAALNRSAVGRKARAVASIVFFNAHAADHLQSVRRLLPDTAGASLISDTLMTIRILAEDSFALRQALLPILDLLTDNAMPKNWKL
ncbi:MAG: urease accessory protein [Yoonia sp.]|jgi:urease accessory protein